MQGEKVGVCALTRVTWSFLRLHLIICRLKWIHLISVVVTVRLFALRVFIEG